MPPVKVAIVEKDVFHRPQMPLGSSECIRGTDGRQIALVAPPASADANGY
jgi:hypothetical protein